jgi:hypothetical protein
MSSIASTDCLHDNQGFLTAAVCKIFRRVAVLSERRRQAESRHDFDGCKDLNQSCFVSPGSATMERI